MKPAMTVVLSLDPSLTKPFIKRLPALGLILVHLLIINGRRNLLLDIQACEPVSRWRSKLLPSVAVLDAINLNVAKLPPYNTSPGDKFGLKSRKSLQVKGPDSSPSARFITEARDSAALVSKADEDAAAIVVHHEVRGVRL
jgi:hypothetical protein